MPTYNRTSRSSISGFNEELEIAEGEINNRLDRTGTTGNQMEVDIDMNSYDLLNVNHTYTSGLTLNGQTVTSVDSLGTVTFPSLSSVTYTNTATGATGRPLQDKLDDVVSVKDFGAVGDGVTDDTSAIQAALDSGKGSIIFPEGSYLISSAISTTSALDFNLQMYGAKIATSTADLTNMLLFDTGVLSVTISGGEFDGGDAAVKAISTRCSTVARDCEIHSLSGTVSASSCIGIDVQISSVSNVLVENCKIYDLEPHTGGSTGDASGSSRAIYIQMASASDGSRVVIRGNDLYNILGREGDAIHIADNIISTGEHDSTVLVEGNYIGKSNRRAVKLFGSNIKFTNNTVDSIAAGDPDVQTSAGLVGVAPSISLGKVKNVTISENTLINNGGLNTSIVLFNTDDFLVSNNKLLCGNVSTTTVAGCLSLQDDCTNGLITGNYIEAETVCAGISSTAVNISISYNKVYFKRESPRSFMEPTATTGFENFRLEYNTFDASTEVIANTSLLGVFFPNVSGATTYDNFTMRGNIIADTSAGRGFILYAPSKTISGLRMVDNFMEGTGNPMTGSGGTFTGCVFVNNNSDDITNQTLP